VRNDRTRRRTTELRFGRTRRATRARARRAFGRATPGFHDRRSLGAPDDQRTTCALFAFAPARGGAWSWFSRSLRTARSRRTAPFRAQTALSGARAFALAAKADYAPT